MTIPVALQRADRELARGDWSASFAFRPTILRAGAEPFELPRPVTAVRLRDGWDFERFKVLRRDGDLLRGQSRQGAEIAISGELLAATDGEPVADDALFDALEALRTALDVSSAEDEFTLGLHHDEESGAWRHFLRCTTVRFDCDVSRTHVFAWTVTIHAEDPTLHHGTIE